MPVEEQLRVLNEEATPLQSDPNAVMEWANETFGGRIAMSTSFGIQSAVLLHVATSIKPDIPVVWVDTGYLPPETYHYANTLEETLSLNLSVWGNREWSAARMEAIHGKLWESDEVEDHTLYGRMRKVEPMNQGLDAIEPHPLVLLSGLRAAQTKARANMPIVNYQNGRFKVLPLLKMSDESVVDYMDKFDLPAHPMQAQNYVTVGDWHSSRPVEEGEDGRATRFGGKFEECGLHVEAHEPVASTSTSTSEESEASASKPVVSAEPVVKKANVPESATKTGLPALEHTQVHSDTDTAVIIVKKINEDGTYCRKCNDVAGKMDADGVTPWVGHTAFADVRDLTSEGAVIARHFDVATAPFFLVRTKEESDRGDEWRVVRSYLQLRKMLQGAADVVEEHKVKMQEEAESGHVNFEETEEFLNAAKQMDELRSRVALLTAQLQDSENAVEETRAYYVERFADLTSSPTLFKGDAGAEKSKQSQASA